jgi:hypothetical protein
MNGKPASHVMYMYMYISALMPTNPSERPWVQYLPYHTFVIRVIRSNFVPKAQALQSCLSLWLIGNERFVSPPSRDGRPPFDDEFRCWNSEFQSFLLSPRDG